VRVSGAVVTLWRWTLGAEGELAEQSPRYGGDVIVEHPIGRYGRWQARTVALDKARKSK
jgi:hypothetical protein